MIAMTTGEYNSIQDNKNVVTAKLEARPVTKGRLPYLKDQGVQFYLDGKKVGKEFYHFYEALGFAQGWAGCVSHNRRRATA